MMRIITGKARGIKLSTLEGDNTRPTSERAKEAIFSMLQFELEGRAVLDLYAGSGQLGLEALSRGAASATLVDKSKDAVEIIKKNIEKTRLDGAVAVCSDVGNFLGRRKGKKYDIIFIDPPYALRAVPDTLVLLLENDLLKPTSKVVCESAEEDIFEGREELSDKFEIIKKAKYGVAHMTVIKPKEETL